MANVTRGRYLLPTTVFATFWLILLGIYTAAIGAGLTCDARWPLCDGAVFGLFPANWTSFIEWFHRLVAMITGFLILGSWWVVWRSSARDLARWAMSIAVLFLPVQVWLGAETVLSYEIVVLTAHFLTALVIFAALIAGAWWWADLRPSSWRRHRLMSVVLVLLLPFVALTPHFLFVHSGRVQLAYYGIGLLMFTGLLVVSLDGMSEREEPPRRTTLLASIGTAALAVQLLAGRLVRTATINTVDWAATLILLVSLIAGLWIAGDLGERWNLSGA